MKRKTPKGVVSIFNENNRIRLSWRYQHKRYSINLSSYTKTNLLQARKLAVSIEHDIALDCFDSTLGKYKPNIVYEKKEWSSLVDLFIKWVVSYRNRDVDSDTDYYLIKQMLIRWGDLPISEAVKKFNAEKIGPKTFNTRLRILKRFFNWMYKEQHVKVNPFEEVEPRKLVKTVKSNRKPFTLEEMKRILQAIRFMKRVILL